MENMDMNKREFKKSIEGKMPEYDETISIVIKKADRMLLRVEPSSLSDEETLRRIPGRIFKLNMEIHKLTTRNEELKNSAKYLEDREFMAVKGSEKQDGKRYTIDEARVTAAQNLKQMGGYQDVQVERTAITEELFEKKNLIELFRDMQRNARVLIEAESKNDKHND